MMVGSRSTGSRFLWLLVPAVLVTACSDDAPSDTPTLEVAVSPASINVASGGSGTSTATITRGGGFAGAADLTASAPAGITVAFTPTTIPIGSTTSDASVAVGGTVAAGTHAVTITASSSGVSDATTTLSVVVVAPGGGGFTLAAAPASLTAPAGGAAQASTITITRSAPFAGAVAFSATGAPTGMTTAFSPASASGASTQLSVTAGASVANGTYPIVVRGTGTGVADATTSVSVTVTGGTAPGVTLALNPTSLSVVAAGASAATTATITRTGGFTGNVNLAVTGMPTGMTATPNPATGISGTTSTITVQAGAGVATGNYNLTVTASGTGVANSTAPLPVTVTGGGGGGSVTYTFCTEEAPTWVASQDGTGAWTRVNPTAGTTYTFTFTSGRGGIAQVTLDGGDTDLSVIYATLAEFTNAASAVNFGNCGDKTVNGSVANVGATEAASVSLGYSSTFVFMATNFQLTDVAPGPQDLVAVRRDLNSLRTNKVILRRGLNIANNGTITPALDFNAGESFAPASANVTVGNLGNDTAFVSATFIGVRGSTFGALSFIAEYLSAAGAQPYDAVPLAQLQANEFQSLEAFAEIAGTDNGDRMVGAYFRTPAAQTLTLGAALSTPTVTKAVTGTVARPRMQLASQAQYNRIVFTDYEQSSIDRRASVIATAAYFGGLPGTWDVAMPDLSVATGWQDTWGLQDGTPIDWSTTAQGGVITFFDATIAEGSTTQSASRSSTTALTLRRGNPLRARLATALRAGGYRTDSPAR